MVRAGVSAGKRAPPLEELVHLSSVFEVDGVPDVGYHGSGHPFIYLSALLELGLPLPGEPAVGPSGVIDTFALWPATGGCCVLREEIR